jgi:hypothetical protein
LEISRLQTSCRLFAISHFANLTAFNIEQQKIWAVREVEVVPVKVVVTRSGRMRKSGLMTSPESVGAR